MNRRNETEEPAEQAEGTTNEAPPAESAENEQNEQDEEPQVSSAQVTSTAVEEQAESPPEGPGLFRLERRPGVIRMTALTLPTSPRSTVVRFDETKNVFQVDLETAKAAVATGAFIVADDSQAKLKE